METNDLTKTQITDAVVEAEKEIRNEEVKSTQNTTTVQLPSNGLMNKNITEVTLRRISTKEMKILHTSSDPNYLTLLLLNCIVEPKNITTRDLHPNDIVYLLFVLRHISSPKKVKQPAICTSCRKETEFDVDVTDLTINYSKVESNEFTITLEESKDTITFKLLSEGEIIDQEKIATRKAKQEERDEEDTAWYVLLSRTAYWILDKNGKEFASFSEKVDYLNTLTAYDFESLRLAYSKEVDKFGLNRKMIITCEKCKEDIEVEAYIAPDFFRLV